MNQAVITKQILIISSAEVEESITINDAFVDALNSAPNSEGITFVWHNYHDIGLELDEDGLHGFIVSTQQSLEDFDAVYFKSYFRYHEQATAIMETLRANNVPFVGSELKEYIPAYKLSQMARLARAGLPIPPTVFLPFEHYVDNYEYLTQKLGEKFIFKAVDGHTGEDNYLITSREQLETIVANSQGMQFIAQAFIPNDSDLRFLIVGNKLQLIIKRSRIDANTHLNNTSQGASAELQDVASYDQTVKDLALQATKLMKRDVSGVDIMLETGTGKPYILEVNASPQIASGAFVDEKLAIYTQYFKELVQ